MGRHCINCLRFAVAFSLASLLTNCASIGGGADASRIQTTLDAIFPASFKGNAFVSHKNSYFKITIQAGNLRRGEKGWEWDWLRYQRDGFVSFGSIILGNPPANLFP